MKTVLYINPSIFFKKYLFIIAYFFSLCFIYQQQISSKWEYMHFINDFSLFKFFLALFTCIPLVFMSNINVSVRNIFINIALYMYFIPALILFVYSAIDLLSIAIIFSSLIIFWSVSNIELKNLKNNFISEMFFISLLLLFSVTVISAIYFFGDKQFNLNLLDVYLYRSDAASNLPGVFNYIISPLSKVLIPTGLVLSLKLKNYNFIFLFLLLSVLLFGFTHHKTIIFIPFFVVVLYFFLQNRKSLYVVKILFILITAIGFFDYLLSLYINEYALFGNFSSFIIRRLLFLPPLLSALYVEFYTYEGYLYWANSSISMDLFKHTSITFTAAPITIGETYFGNNVWANSGLVGSGYSNAGTIGVVLYSMVFGILISVLNNYGKTHGHVTVSSIAMPSLITILVSSDFLTSFLTHGVLLLLIVMNIIRPLK